MNSWFSPKAPTEAGLSLPAGALGAQPVLLTSIARRDPSAERCDRDNVPGAISNRDLYIIPLARTVVRYGIDTEAIPRGAVVTTFVPRVLTASPRVSTKRER